MVRSSRERLLEYERIELKVKSGGGLLSYEVRGLGEGHSIVVTRYSLAWINPLVFSGDNGRVLGFDNAHGFHHRHCFGKVEAVEFESFEATHQRFQDEWMKLVRDLRGGRK